MIPSAVGAALSLSATQPDFATSGRSRSLSNEINATESTNQLIWTALISSAPTLERGMDPGLQRGALFLLRIIEIDWMGDGLALGGFAFYL
jgi:hypothetical protein